MRDWLVMRVRVVEVLVMVAAGGATGGQWWGGRAGEGLRGGDVEWLRGVEGQWRAGVGDAGRAGACGGEDVFGAAGCGCRGPVRLSRALVGRRGVAEIRHGGGGKEGADRFVVVV